RPRSTALAERDCLLRGHTVKKLPIQDLTPFAAYARARARSSARRANTGIIARLYSSLACRSELIAVSPAPAFFVAAAIVSADAGLPASCCSTSHRRTAFGPPPARPTPAPL